MLCLDLLVNLPRVRLHSAVAQASLVKQVVGLQTVLPEARSEGDQDFKFPTSPARHSPDEPSTQTDHKSQSRTYGP